LNELRLIHTADLHLGTEAGPVDTDGLGPRTSDAIRRLSDCIEYAIQNHVDLFVFAGDAYKSRNPTQTLQRAFVRQIKRLVGYGITVVLVPGNHDRSRNVNRANVFDVFEALDIRGVIVGQDGLAQTITTLSGKRVWLATVPYPATNGMDSAEVETLLLKDIDNAAWTASQAAPVMVPRVLVGHFALAEATPGAERGIMVGRDATVPVSRLNADVFDYVALGHIHKHQEWGENVAYCGSIERVDFGEEGDAKGWLDVTIDANAKTTVNFIEQHNVQARSFVTLRADVRQEANPAAAIRGMVDEAIAGGKIADAVVRLEVMLLPEQQGALNEAEVNARLDSVAQSHVMHKTIDRVDRKRLGGASAESMTREELLRNFFVAKGIGDADTEALVDQGVAIMQEQSHG